MVLLRRNRNDKNQIDMRTEISKVYCRPKNYKDWHQLMLVNISARNAIRRRYRGNIVFFQLTPVNTLMDVFESDFYKGDRTEVPVDRFIDLLEDRIVPWRLEEIGFINTAGELIFMEFKSKIKEHYGRLFIKCLFDKITKEAFIDIRIGAVTIPMNITTFTELETLIKFLK